MRIARSETKKCRKIEKSLSRKRQSLRALVPGTREASDPVPSLRVGLKSWQDPQRDILEVLLRKIRFSEAISPKTV
jgi:hypothetical protein